MPPPDESLFDDLPAARAELAGYLSGLVSGLVSETASAIDRLSNDEWCDEKEAYEAYHAASSTGAVDYVEFLCERRDSRTLSNDQAERVDSLVAELRGQVDFQCMSCNFTNQVGALSSLYQEQPLIADLCGYFRCPIIESSELDLVVLTSVNPFAGKLVGQLLSTVIYRETQALPFIFLTTSSVRAIDYLCRKHFAYES